MVVLSSSKLTVAVFVASETTTLTTPGTASRLLLTVIGQAEQYIPGTASFTVFSPASAADEVNRLMPRNATPRALVMPCHPFSYRKAARRHRMSARRRRG